MGFSEQEMALIEAKIEMVVNDQRQVFESLLSLKNMVKRLRREFEKAEL